MKASFCKYILAAALTASAGTMMAQDLNSGYFIEDYKYRHDMNPAFGNDQGYAAIPVLGNLNANLQGSLGVGDLFYANPDYGRVAGAKKTASFLHPSISADQVLSNLSKDGNSLILSMDVPIVSVGFKAFNGYNTIELRERTYMGISLPYEFFQFAKDLRNQSYSFDGMDVTTNDYVELGFGHSRQIFDNLRVGAKVKILLGGAYGKVSFDGVHANLQGDQWVIDGKARAELSMKGATFKEESKEYKSKPGTYKQVNDFNVDGAGIGGFGLGLDLGAAYKFKDCSVDWLNGMQVSLALTDLGYIKWSNTMVAESSGTPFVFDGFNNFDVKEGDGKTSFSDKSDEVGDRLVDFAHLENKGDEGGKSHGIGTTMRLGIEYPLPVYDKLTFGLLGTHRFQGDYSWSEARLSANCAPLGWLNGGLNVAFTSFCTTMGWVLNVHPKGFNIFFGMDHMVGKRGASMVPLDSNVSFNFGMNITWGGSKKSSKTLNTLTF